MTKEDEKFMRIALNKAKQGVENKQTPFGCCIVKDGKVIASAHNVVWKTTDITAHAEITAIRKACKKLKSISLKGCTLYSTTEPCPMCFSACHWADITRIVYGTSIKDAKKFGFKELVISDKKMLTLGGIAIKLTPGVLRKENLEFWKQWSKRKDKRTY